MEKPSVPLPGESDATAPDASWRGEALLRPLGWVLAALLLGGFLLVGTHLDRGFDFSDEGVYYLNFQFPKEFPAGFTQYHLFGARVYELFGGNIVALRALPWLALLLTTLFFGAAWIRFFRNVIAGVPGVIAGIFLLLTASVFVSFSWPPPGLSYNSMADLGMLVAAGSLLFMAAPQGSSLMRAAGVAGFAGSLVFLLVVKGSAAVGVGFAGALFLLAVPSLPWRWKLGLLLVGVAALVAGGAILWFLAREQLAGVFDFFLAHSRNFFGALWSGSPVDPMLQRHWEEVWHLPWRVLLSYNLPVILGVVLGLIGRFGPSAVRPPSRIFDGGIGVVFIALLVSIYSKGGYLAGITHRHGSILAYAALLGILLALLIARAPIAAAKENGTAPRGTLLLCWVTGLLFFALPFVTAAGTTHRIYINALLHLGPFFGLIALVAFQVARRCRTWLPWVLTLFVTTLVAGSQFLHGGFFVPYRLPSALWQMHESVEIGVPSTRLRLDTESARFTRELQTLLAEAGFKAGDDLLALFDMPGVVFAMGGKSPGRPWYFPNYGEQGERENLASLRIAGRDRIAKAIVLQSNHDPRVTEYLASQDLSFPGDYELIGETQQPFRNWTVSVWRPRR